MKTSTFSVINFGCRTTQSDGAAIEEALLNKNLRKEEIEGKSDLVIINTCTVTKTADAEARQTIRRIHRRNPDTKIVVTGCYAQRAPEEIIQIRGVTSVIGNSHKDQLASLIVNNHLSVKDSLVNKENSSILPGGPSVYCSSIFESTELRSIADMSGGGRTRAFLKVQDGCSYRCSYCVIPFVRGHSRSLPLEEVLYQVRYLLRQGYREIVLTGIHLGGYGRELKNKTDLIALAQTGTGKTAAFGTPIIHQIIVKENYTQCIILCPTRELCIQITKDLQTFSQYMNVKINAVYGGTDIKTQIKSLSKRNHIIVGTPGRVIDLIKRKKINLEQIKTVVMDEADEMLNMGLKKDIDTILQKTPKNKLSRFKFKG